MEESYLTRRLIIIAGSLIALFFVNAVAGWIFPPAQPIVDAAAGYAFGVITHRYWGS